MREILFRGKDVNSNKWRIGYFYTAVQGCVAIIGDGIYGYQVKPETIGQYTGLTDKYGKRVFEGDILSGQLDDLFPTEESRYEVIWHDYGWHIKDNSGMDTADKKWIKQYFKVIGNIYDNPELMGEGGK